MLRMAEGKEEMFITMELKKKQVFSYAEEKSKRSAASHYGV